MYRANICLFDADMLVFLDESGFVSWHATDLHVQSYRVKIFFFFFLEVLITSQGKPTNT